MKKILPALTLLLLIFTSGCTVPFLEIEIPFLPDLFGGMTVKEQKDDVIVINRLDAIPSTTVRSGQSIRLRAVVKNLQKPEYKPIDNVTIQLYNYCDMFTISGETCTGGEKPEDKDKDGTYECTIRMLPLQTALVEWKLVAKDINVETPCKIGVLVKYKYTTYSDTSVTFINKAEVERLIAEGKTFSETGVASIGEGPVKPYVEVLNQPIIIDVEAGSHAGATAKDYGSGIMSFWIENKGDGILELAESQKGNVVFNCKTPESSKVCLHIEATKNEKGEEDIKAINTTNQQKISIQDCIKEHLIVNQDKTSINIINKKTPKYSCSISVYDPSRIKQEVTWHIKTEISYWYKFTKEVTVTVQPRIKL